MEIIKENLKEFFKGSFHEPNPIMASPSDTNMTLSVSTYLLKYGGISWNPSRKAVCRQSLSRVIMIRGAENVLCGMRTRSRQVWLLKIPILLETS